MEYAILAAALFLPIFFAAWSTIDLVRYRPTRSQIYILATIVLFGLAIGIYLGFFFTYLGNPTTRIISFPLPAAAFQKEPDSEVWLDYVSSLTPFIACWNVFIVFTLSLFIFSIYRLLRRRTFTSS